MFSVSYADISEEPGPFSTVITQEVINMSCFLVPAAEAIAMTAVKHSVKKKEAQAALTEGSHVSISSEP